MNIKTIDVNAKEWFDRVNGNSYFSAAVTINYGMPDEFSFPVPFQYGYGDSYRHAAFKELQKQGIIPEQDDRTSYWQYYRDNNIIDRHSIKERCLKREVIAWGTN